MSQPVPAGGLFHPVPVIAVALLLLNDHWLKAAHPSWMTGKLSDVAGMVFFPLMLQALWEMVASRFQSPFKPSKKVLLWCVVLTALVFGSIQLFPWAADGYRWGLGMIQWPFWAARALVSGSGVPALAPVAHVADPTDLVALPGVLIAWWTGKRRI
ncbi:MAG: hypothetical protein HN348_29370 [Proteobacteria bacterium]|jgi:hypothetical protein|nr:hypothetical protein [Pseudomonadota bacterium]